MVDIQRHEKKWNTAKAEIPILIIGAGATGSFFTYSLVKMGYPPELITVADKDVVEFHNIPNQLYCNADVNNFKVIALQEKCKALVENPINIINEFIDSSSDLTRYGIIFCLTDTMSSRKEILDAVIEQNKNMPCRFVETRLGEDSVEMYSFDSDNQLKIDTWNKNWFPDDSPNVQMSACGTSTTILDTVLLCNSMLLRHTQHLSKNDLDMCHFYYQINLEGFFIGAPN